MKYKIATLFMLMFSTHVHADGFGFMTPSENIYCNGYVSDGGGVDCTIEKRRGQTATPKPKSCKGIWGHDFSLKGSGQAELTCANSVEDIDFYPVFSYGQKVEIGNIICSSSKKGLECTNKDGNGFFLSRNRQIVYGATSQRGNSPQLSKTTDCLNVDIRRSDYSITRNRLFEIGWEPVKFSPPFEGAPFADWVKKQNYQEVDVCAPTGTAKCKFVFRSQSNSEDILAIFTEGEDAGIVTGHQCLKSNDQFFNPLPTHERQAAKITDSKKERQKPRVKGAAIWSKYRLDSDYWGAGIDFNGVALNIHCPIKNSSKSPPAIKLFFEEKAISEVATFYFDDGKQNPIYFDESSFEVETRSDATFFNALVAKLKANHSVVIKTDSGETAKLSLKGSSKALQNCAANPKLFPSAETQFKTAKADGYENNIAQDNSVEQIETATAEEPKQTLEGDNDNRSYEIASSSNSKQENIASQNKQPTKKLWKHGDKCPANLELANRYNTAGLFENGPLSSGKFLFFPTSGTVSRNYKLTFLQNSDSAGSNWCQERGEIAYHAPYDIYRLGLYKIRHHFLEFGCTIRKLCPSMKTLSYTVADKDGLKSFYTKGSIHSNFVPLTDEEFAELESGSPLECDRVAGHPGDSLLPTGVEGLWERNMDAAKAKEVCARDIAKNPDIERLQFQIGRAYLLLGQFDDAFAAFSIAAQKRYPMGVMYLGHAYANGWGTEADLKQANIYWRSGGELGGTVTGARKLELTVAKATNTRARVICDWKDDDCERKARRPQYTSSMTSKQRDQANRIFSDIHIDMRPIYGGFIAADFEGLQLIKYDLLDRGTSKNTVIGHVSPLLPGLKDAMELRTEKSRFEPIIAQYALAKTNLMGLCGEPAQRFEVTHTVIETWRDGYGIEVSSTTREIGKSYFSVPTRFAALITKTKTTGEWATYSSGLEQFLKNSGGCNSETLGVLEKNMFAYLNWTPTKK